ncbi:MAG: ATP-dependent helicase HrpB [Chloroflexota bacterium]
MNCDKTYPIDDVLPDLLESVREHPSVVLQAPTGAGKTTRVPLALLDLITPGAGRIVMLEPRRLAAVSAARWMAHLLGEEVGQTVGYSIRFDSRVSKRTRVEVVTEGILARRLQTDPGLGGVAMVIFDEFHERNIHSDLALALCLDVRRGLREDLKILVMSATMDCRPIAALLGEAPVITSQGKAYPVEERYLTTGRDVPLEERTGDAVLRALAETSGDILVFLPGSREIRACAEWLGSALKGNSGGITIHPLYGDMPFKEQERAIVPLETRKVVLATNIAETSLTIEGVRAVIDSGLTRMVRHDPSTGMNRLVTVSASRASAEQRKGRAGRLGPGACYRLYSLLTFQSFVPYTPPEILVSDLSSLVLELAAWGVREPSALSWLDSPPVPAVESAVTLLRDLGALDSGGSITPAGKTMVRLPLHPRLARLLVRSAELGCPHIGADLASLLSERDIIRRNTEQRTQRGADVTDRLEMLRAWRRGTTVAAADPWALRISDTVSKQLLRLISDKGKTSSGEPDDPDLISRLLLCAFPDRVAKRRGEGDGRFLMAQGRGVNLPSGCELAVAPFVVAVNVDLGDRTEGIVHAAAPVTEEMIREELAGKIETARRVEWDRRENRIFARIEERLGEIILSSKNFNPGDDEAAPLMCDAVRVAPSLLTFGEGAVQFQCRVALMRRAFPEEAWPDLSAEHLLSDPSWLLPFLGRCRTAPDVARVDVLSPLRGLLSRQQQRSLDERAPSHLTVPSGHRIALDYTAGEIPVLAVKLQELFGLADTPTVAAGRVKVLLHLLSPAGRPVQVTQDLKGFWNNGYQQVKKELKGRYPKHPWPDDPWHAVPTRGTKRHGR